MLSLTISQRMFKLYKYVQNKMRKANKDKIRKIGIKLYDLT